MDSNIKKTLDIRLARGEISEAEYRSLLKTISTSTQSVGDGVKSVLKRVVNGASTAVDKMLGMEQIHNDQLKSTPTNDAPLEVTKDFVVYSDYVLYKGQRIGYDQMIGLSYSSVDSTTKTYTGFQLGMNCTIKFKIQLKDKSWRIDLQTKASSAFFGKNILLVKAYSFIRTKTFQQRMDAYIKKLEQPGFIAINGAKLYRNGDIEKNGTRVNLHNARKNKMIQKGTSYGGWYSPVSGTNPNEIIVGENGTGIFSRRVKFEVDQDHDILLPIIEHLAEGKLI